VCTDFILSEADAVDPKETDYLKDNVVRIANALEGLGRIAENTLETLIKICEHQAELKTRVIFSAPPLKPGGAGGSTARASRLGAGTIARFADGAVHPKPKGRPNKMAREVDPWNGTTGCWIDKDGNDIP
jgi:hypothetical protein